MINRYNRYHDMSSRPEPTAAGSFEVRLEIRRGEARQLARVVAGPVFTLGASETCELVLGDPQFPDLHGYLWVRDQTVTLRQIGNGPLITVNGRVVRWGELLDRDRIRTGPYEFLLRVVASDGSGSATTEQVSEACDRPASAWRSQPQLGPVPRWRSVTVDKGFSIRAK